MTDMNWGGAGYAEYGGECQSKKTFGERQGYQQSMDDRNSRDAEVGKQDETLGKMNPTLDYYGGAPEDSSLYKTLKTTGIESTNHAYDNAKAAVKLHGRVAGFGYEQPAMEASDSELEQSRAGDLSRVPREALSATIQPQLQAQSLRLGQAGQYGHTADMFSGDSTAFFGAGNSAEQKRRQSDDELRRALSQALAQAGTAAIAGG